MWNHLSRVTFGRPPTAGSGGPKVLAPTKPGPARLVRMGPDPVGFLSVLVKGQVRVSRLSVCPNFETFRRRWLRGLPRGSGPAFGSVPRADARGWAGPLHGLRGYGGRGRAWLRA